MNEVSEEAREAVRRAKAEKQAKAMAELRHAEAERQEWQEKVTSILNYLRANMRFLVESSASNKVVLRVEKRVRERGLIFSKEKTVTADWRAWRLASNSDPESGSSSLYLRDNGKLLNQYVKYASRGGHGGYESLSYVPDSYLATYTKSGIADEISRMCDAADIPKPDNLSAISSPWHGNIPHLRTNAGLPNPDPVAGAKLEATVRKLPWRSR